MGAIVMPVAQRLDIDHRVAEPLAIEAGAIGLYGPGQILVPGQRGPAGLPIGFDERGMIAQDRSLRIDHHRDRSGHGMRLHQRGKAAARCPEEQRALHAQRAGHVAKDAGEQGGGVEPFVPGKPRDAEIAGKLHRGIAHAHLVQRGQIGVEGVEDRRLAPRPAGRPMERDEHPRGAGHEMHAEVDRHRAGPDRKAVGTGCQGGHPAPQLADEGGKLDHAASSCGQGVAAGDWGRDWARNGASSAQAVAPVRAQVRSATTHSRPCRPSVWRKA